MAYVLPPTQIFVEDDEGLLDELCTRGLKVVEIYSEWCGNCTSVVPTMKRLRMEKDDEATLKFLCVKVDGITCVEKFEEYKTMSQPTFFFFRNGVLKETVVGANTPAIDRLVSSWTPMSVDADDVAENPMLIARKEAEAARKAAEEAKKAEEGG